MADGPAGDSCRSEVPILVNSRAMAAIAVFVKTPGFSSVKTRLAATIGVTEAERFYSRCVDAVEAVLSRACHGQPLVPYWAVAEPEAMSHLRWRTFERVSQGEGGLGERLHRVYSRLRTQHRNVLLIGADAPLITMGTIAAAINALDEGTCPFGLSRASDGGYGLFAGCRHLPENVWTSVPYSSEETAAVFIESLRQHGCVTELPRLDDVDSFEDLLRLASRDCAVELFSEQAGVIDFAKQICRRFPSSVDKG